LLTSAPNNPKWHSRLFRGIIWLHVRLAFAMPGWHRASLRAYRDSLGGTLPRPGPGGILLSACDERYYHLYGRTLLCSLEQQNQRQRVHLHLYAPSPAILADIESLRQRFSHAEVSYTIDSCLLARGQPFPVMYYASARFLLASALLEEVGDPLLCVDVDAIARGPVWEAYESLRSSGDVGLIFRDEAKRHWRKILASAVGLNPSGGARTFCSAVARAQLSLFRYKPRYHIDQIVLYYASQVAATRGVTAFFDIPKKFSDFEFHPDSIIWTAKGHRKAGAAFQERKRGIDAAFSGERGGGGGLDAAGGESGKCDGGN